MTANCFTDKTSAQTSNSLNIAAESHTIELSPRILPNYLLIWLNENIDESKQDCQNALAQLRDIVNDIYIFTSPDDCIDFLTEIDNQKAFMILSGVLGQHLIPIIHEIPQLEITYVYCSEQTQHEQLTKIWPKVKGVYTEITCICKALQQAIMQCNQDSISMSFISPIGSISSQNLDQLEPSFMYTQILKEILFEIEYDQRSIYDFTAYCRSGNDASMTNINKFEDQYCSDLAIWWYTYPSFIFSMLNSSLRTLESNTIIKMGFFIRDLHLQIRELHQQQLDRHHDEVFIVYRGQGLSIQDFEKLQQGRLMSFNNFLSTSKNREFSFDFAMCALTKNNSVGILFQITIDPSISSIPFAAIDEISYYKTEQEVLFSMHTVFRIGEIKEINNNNRLYQVELQLTADDDRELRTLTEQIRKETYPNAKGWHRMGQLLIKLGQLNQAECVYLAVLRQTTNDIEKPDIYYQLGRIKGDQGDYDNAISFYKKALKIYEKTLPLNHICLAHTNNNIGVVYENMGEHSKAISFYEKALETYEKSLSPNHPGFATSYNNIGGLCNTMGEYSKALSFYEKSLENRKQNLPSNHPDLAVSYNNIGLVYKNRGEYPKSLFFHEKANEIFEKTLPSNHPDLATSYNNIGLVYDSMGDYSKALSFYEKVLQIYQTTLSSTHPSLATCYNNMGFAYNNMKEYLTALSFYEKALQIQQGTLSPDHPSLATSYNNIGLACMNMDLYSEAVLFFEKALKIDQNTLPSDHPNLAISYNNIGAVYVKMREYSKALPIFEKALEICKKNSSFKSFFVDYFL
ncbi:unnamed protein product [Rotaria sp. Silwood2]|nr:unnamed protein product [Rotaria sp. Silwood2]